jgi:acetyl esterase/lipase
MFGIGLIVLVAGALVFVGARRIFFGGRGGSISSGDVPADVTVEPNVAYGSDPAQVMDIYRRTDASNAPVVFMVHGGGWRRGDKAANDVVTNKMKHYTSKGYIFVSTNYRLSSDVNPVEEANDIAQALAFAQQHAASWGGAPAKFVVMGHSAGANLVSLLTAEPDMAKSHDAQPWLGTVALDSAAYNVVTIMDAPHLRLYDQAFDHDQALWVASSPTLQLKTAPAAPMLLVCSSDRADSCPQANAFATKAKSLGGKVTVLPEALRHGNINANLGLPGAYTDSVDAFLHTLGLP